MLFSESIFFNRGKEGCLVSLRDELKKLREPQPYWLERIHGLTKNDVVSHFLSSRNLFYSGSRSDGGPIASFNSAGACHCFIYVDYTVSRAEILQQAQHSIRGYSSIAHFELDMSDLTPRGWTPTSAAYHCRKPWAELAKPYGFIEILERNPTVGRDHGAHRFALLCLGADGFAGFDALFCQPSSLQSPWCVVIQDHGFGLNYDRFGRGGILERLASHAKDMPRLLLVGDNSEAWNGYTRVPDVDPEQMGQPAHYRYLWQRDD